MLSSQSDERRIYKVTLRPIRTFPRVQKTMTFRLELFSPSAETSDHRRRGYQVRSCYILAVSFGFRTQLNWTPDVRKNF